MKLKYILASICVFIVGFFIDIVISIIFDPTPDNSYLFMIGSSILYFASIVFLCTLMTINKSK